MAMQHLKYDPFDLQFAEQKVDEKQVAKESTVSINMGHQTILMYNMQVRTAVCVMLIVC